MVILRLILLEIDRMVEGGVKKTMPVIRFSFGGKNRAA
jgi:hypothetical protein